MFLESVPVQVLTLLNTNSTINCNRWMDIRMDGCMTEG